MGKLHSGNRKDGAAPVKGADLQERFDERVDVGFIGVVGYRHSGIALDTGPADKLRWYERSVAMYAVSMAVYHIV